MSALVVKMAHVGEMPWHNDSVLMAADATDAEWKAQSGFDFVVDKAGVKFNVPNGAGGDYLLDFQSRVVTYRRDNGQPLGVVNATKYKLVQPSEIHDTIRAFCAAAGAKVEIMGVLRDSSRIFALARLDHEIRLPGDDVSRPYFLITTSFDGDTATIGTFTIVRVVCWNTISAALEIFRDERDDAEKKGRQLVTGFAIPHNAGFSATAAAGAAANLYKAALQYEANAQLLAATGASEEQMLRYFVSLVGSLDQKGKLTSQSQTKIDRMVELYRSGPGADLKSAKGTVWGLLNAVTRYVDFDARERQPGGRLISSWYGSGKELKTKAMAAALQLAA